MLEMQVESIEKIRDSCCCGPQIERESGARVKTESAVETKGQKQVRGTGTCCFTRMSRWISWTQHPQDTELW